MLPRGCPQTFVKYGSTTTAGSTSAADIAEQRGQHHTSTPYARDQYPRRRRKPRDNQSIGKSAQAITVAGVGIQHRIRDILAAAGVRVVEHGPGQFSLKRKDVQDALIALRRHKLSPVIREAAP